MDTDLKYRLFVIHVILLLIMIDGCRSEGHLARIEKHLQHIAGK
jgi:hypothetical protein